MGGAQSRRDLDISDSEDDGDNEEEQQSEEETDQGFSTPSSGQTLKQQKTPVDEVDEKLRSLKLKYSTPQKNSNPPNSVKLYLFSTRDSKWSAADKLARFSFVRSAADSDRSPPSGGDGEWDLRVGSMVRVRVGPEMKLQMFPNQKRVDFVSDGGVWAMKFFSDADYRAFLSEYQRREFENTFGSDRTEENEVKVYGKDFIGWARPGSADESIWGDAEEEFERSRSPVTPSPFKATPAIEAQDLLEEFEEEASNGGGGGIQSLALGALENSFLVGESGIQVVKNFSHGIHGKGVTVKLHGADARGRSTAKKALLMRAETNMLLMSPLNAEGRGGPRSTGVHQLDLETGKVVTEWKFGKDGADITMTDITNDSKGAQLDPSESTFLGLDDNRLCRWDMRDRHGIVQDLMSPVLNWTQGHQFSRGTNFQCFASTGDGSIVVGSLDGKIRLYSKSSMRMAKTAFPGLGSPVTHVDVTFDGKWILGTTDTYLILISTVFKDKDGKEKTGFSGRMGSRIAAPRLLKLTPLDSHRAGIDNKFRKGQFSWVTENGKQERHLVATVGKFSAIWNFIQVKNSSHECYHNQEGLKSCYCYKVVLRDESIVDSRFMHDKFAVSDSPEAPLVVATPMKVSSFSISNRSRLQF
ncbi:Protein CYPRO4 [Acorus calamus]|uniref:Protein CYPRO4 n=1 Tax=Acorus calamus TaxID=4465 RepID=A0AAV9E8D3_ACOCL|nr:Protein CYPRO4 [Acorus calamus]